MILPYAQVDKLFMAKITRVLHASPKHADKVVFAWAFGCVDAGAAAVIIPVLDDGRLFSDDFADRKTGQIVVSAYMPKTRNELMEIMEEIGSRGIRAVFFMADGMGATEERTANGGMQ